MNTITSTSRPHHVIFWIIVLVAAILRFWHLTFESFWLDEGISAWYAQLPLGQVIPKAMQTGTNPPLFYLALNLWANIFGSGELALRTLTALLSLAAVPLVYAIGKTLWNVRTGLIAAALMAVSDFQIRFAQECRPYSLLAFLSCVTFFLMIHLLYHRRSVMLWIAFVLSSILLLYSHPYGVFVVAGENLGFVVFWLRHRRGASSSVSLPRWIVAQLIIAAAFAPWLMVMLHKAAAIQDKPLNLPAPIWTTPLDIARMHTAGNTALFALCGILCVMALFYRRSAGRVTSTPKHLDTLILLASWMLIPLLVPVIISMASEPIFQSRYSILLGAPLYILIAAGLGRFASHRIAAIITAVIAVVLFSHTLDDYRRIDKAQWRQSVTFIESRIAPDEYLIVHAPYYLVSIYDYYAQDDTYSRLAFPSDHRDVSDRDLAELDHPASSAPGIWLVLAHTCSGADKIVRYLAPRYAQHDRLDFYRVGVHHFSRPHALTVPPAGSNPGKQ